jgi:hypothetical protein
MTFEVHIWWYTSVIPATREAETGAPLSGARQKVPDPVKKTD